jgi:3-methyl-2-oxobutanoate hydroxymethyltransferase
MPGAEGPWTSEVKAMTTTESVASKTRDAGRSTRSPMTAPAVAARKGGGKPLVMVTAYDAPSARVVDAAGADMILVGDSVAMVVLGYDDTMQVTIDDMAHHVGAVARTKPSALIVGDLPWMSYHLDRSDAVRNAAALVRAGAGAVKLEGGRKRLDVVRAILDAEVPVMGHIGLTPQSVLALGGFKVQGKQLDAAHAIVEDAVALADAGCFAVLMECVPDGVARMVTDSIAVPTIGIGAGRHVDGQVLVYHDLLGMTGGDRKAPKFVRRYADLESAATSAVGAFVADVRAGTFPSSAETYHMADSMTHGLQLYGSTSPAPTPSGAASSLPPRVAPPSLSGSSGRRD